MCSPLYQSLFISSSIFRNQKSSTLLFGQHTGFFSSFSLPLSNTSTLNYIECSILPRVLHKCISLNIVLTTFEIPSKRIMDRTREVIGEAERAAKSLIEDRRLTFHYREFGVDLRTFTEASTPRSRPLKWKILVVLAQEAVCIFTGILK